MPGFPCWRHGKQTQCQKRGDYWRGKQLQPFAYKAAMLKDSENLSNVSLHTSHFIPFLPPIFSPGASSEISLVPLPADSLLIPDCLSPWFWVSVLSNLLQSVKREDVHGQLSGSK